MSYLPWIFVIILVSVILAIAYQIGNGNILTGLKMYFDLGYKPEGEENEEIARALDALAQRIIDRHGNDWTVVAENGTGITITDGEGNVHHYTSAESLLRAYRR